MVLTQLGTCFCEFIRKNSIENVSWVWKINPYIIETDSCFGSIMKFDLSTRMNWEVQQDTLLREISAGFFAHWVHSTIDGGTIWSYVRKRNEEIYLQYYVNSSWDKVTLLQDNTCTAGALAFEYLGQIFPYCALKHNILTFHGVLMEHEGRGIVISAPSGTGKTTHARMWRDYKNALIINGDRATCQKVDGRWMGYGLPWSGTSGEQINRSVPLTALVVLERGETNYAEVMSPQEAFGAILPHIQCPTWDGELVGKAMDLADDFLNNIPVIRLSCRPDKEAVEVLNQVLEEI